MILLPVLAVEFGRSTYIHFRAARPLDAAAIMGIGMLILMLVLCGGYFPNAPYLGISNQVADVLKSEGATHLHDVIMIDYKEPSLAFYQGGTIRPERDNRFLQKIPPLEWPRWIVLTGKFWDTTPPQIRDQLVVVKKVRGFDYADGGRVVDVLVLRKR